MTSKIMTSREFNQDASGAKNAAKNGPVFITDRGRPAHVLMSIEQYLELSGKKGSIVEQLAMPQGQDVEFEAPALLGDAYQPADFS